MIYRTSTIPKPSEGISFIGVKDEVVPDQSMSLQYILEKFTRGEPLAVAHPTSEGVQDEDLEKIRHADLVDKAAYSAKLEGIKKAHEKQEAKKAKAQKEKDEKERAEAFEKKVQEEVQKRTSGNVTT